MRLKTFVMSLITALCVLCLMRTATARVVIELVDIPDANLRAAINKTLNKPTDALINKSEILNLTKLNAEDIGISDLTGLEYATNLVELSLVGRHLTEEERTRFIGLRYDGRFHHLFNSRTPLVDVAPLASNLKKLTKLRLKDIHIVDATPLSNLKNLTELKLFNGGLEDISPLSALTHLSKLDLSKNGISDVSPLAGLTHLTDLSLATNAISDVSPLSGLTQLTTLNLNNNIISHISPLAGLTHLKALSLRNNELSDVSPLAALTRLIRLEIGNESFVFANYNRIMDVSPLAALTHLVYLDISRTRISDISSLTALTQLEVLGLSNNPLNADAINIHIPAIEARGTEVSF